MLQRASAIILVFILPLKMYSGYGAMHKVPWFENGSAWQFHMNAAIDITLLFCILLHAFYGIRVILIDFGWIREDKFFWRFTALAGLIFCVSVWHLYLR